MDYIKKWLKVQIKGYSHPANEREETLLIAYKNVLNEIEKHEAELKMARSEDEKK